MTEPDAAPADPAPTGPCDVCGRPGVLRHFPGASPASGLWCDRHHRRLLWLHPLGARGRWLYGAGALGLLLLWTQWRA